MTNKFDFIVLSNILNMYGKVYSDKTYVFLQAKLHLKSLMSVCRACMLYFSPTSSIILLFPSYCSQYSLELFLSSMTKVHFGYNWTCILCKPKVNSKNMLILNLKINQRVSERLQCGAVEGWQILYSLSLPSHFFISYQICNL